MSFSKRILFDGDPRDDVFRRELAEKTARMLAPFVHKIGLNRRNRLGRTPHWDPAWSSCLTSAATELGKQHVIINSQVCFLTRSEADEVRARAEQLHKKRAALLLKIASA